MNPTAEIAKLDRFLARDGEEIILRYTKSAGTNAASSSVVCRAKVTFQSAEDLVGSVSQNEFVCILSPTQINAAQWPGGLPSNVTGDQRIPSKTRGDFAFIRGVWRAVQSASGIYPQGVLVRIDMRVMG